MDDNISQLRITIEKLRAEFNNRLNHLEERLIMLEDQEKTSMPNRKSDPDALVSYDPETHSTDQAEKQTSDADADIDATEHNADRIFNAYPAVESQKDSASATEASGISEVSDHGCEPKSCDLDYSPPKPSGFKPREYNPALERFLSSLLELSQLALIFNAVMSHYQEQKDKGNGTFFLLTASGILISVVGFGYLLQLMIGVLPPVLKVAFGFGVTGSVFMLGFWLRSKARLTFTTAIFGLALLLGQTSVFFTGPYFSLISPVMSFIGFAIFTAIGYFFAYWLHTQTLAMIALLGGIFLPWVCDAPQAMTLPFAGFLLILNMATLHLAKMLRIKSLVAVAITLTPITLEAQLFIVPDLGAGFVLLVHGFFVLYVATLYRYLAKEVNGKSLSLISANLVFYIFITLQWFYFSGLEVSWVPYALVALGLCAIAGRHYLRHAVHESKTHPVFVLSVLQAGVLFVVAIIAGFGLQGAGALACLQAWLLISMGVRFNTFSIRLEGYIVYGVALLMNVVALLPWVVSQEFSVRPEPLFFACVGITAFLCARLLYPLVLKGSLDTMMHSLYKELFSFWLMLLIYGGFWFFAPQWLLVAAAFQIPIIIYRHARCHIPVSQASIYVHYILLTLQWISSAEQVGTLSFRSLDIYGQAALVLGFVYLYFMPKLYEKLLADGQLKRTMQYTKVVFYLLLPLFFLPSIARHHEKFLPISLWVSAAIALCVYYKKPKPVIGLELKLLVVMASCIGIYASFGYGVAGTIGKWSHIFGLALFVIVIIQTNAYKKNHRTSKRLWSVDRLPALQLLVSFSYYWAGFLILLLMMELTREVFAGVLAAMLYNVSIVIYWQRMQTLRHRKLKHLGVLLKFFWLSTLISAWVVLQDNRSQYLAWLCVMLGATVMVLYYYGWFRHQKLLLVFGYYAHQGVRSVELVILHVTLFLAYLSTVSLFTQKLLGPAATVGIIVQFILVLFLPSKASSDFTNKFSLSLFGLAAGKILLFDLKDFSIVEKIISFIAIGILLLVASFQYQKRKARCVESESVSGVKVDHI